MSTPTWENLAKNGLNAQTISEAIAEGIAAHEDDPGAHLGAGESLESHRASEIIDHLAESVVNDKLQRYTRTYTAIVDPSNDYDYDTIDSAVDYVASLGGGSIYLVPGTHYVGGVLTIPRSINIYGSDAESTIIACERSDNKYLILEEDTTGGQATQVIQGVGFNNIDGGCIYATAPDYTPINRIYFNNCKFTGGGHYIGGEIVYVYLNGCEVECSDQRAVGVLGKIYFIDTLFTRYGSSNNLVACGSDPVIEDVVSIFIRNCQFKSGGATTCYWIDAGSLEEGYIFESSFETFDTSNIFPNFQYIINNTFAIKSTRYFDAVGTGCIVMGNIFTGGTGDRLRVQSGYNNAIIIGNNIGTGITDDATGTIIAGNTPPVKYRTITSTATALDMAGSDTTYHAPTATKTLTTTVPRAGEIRQLILFQTNTTPKTMTFGTGFKTTGTLALGTASNRYFTLLYVSNGTDLIEIARSTAMA